MRAIDFFAFDFYDDQLTLFMVDEPLRQVPFYLPMRRLCEAMQIDYSSQLRRIKGDPVLRQALIELDIRHLTTGGEGDDPKQWGGLRKPVAALWLKRLPFWLGGLNANRVRADLRDKVIRYQLELAEVVWDVTRTQIMPPDVLAEMDAQTPPAEQEYHRLMDEAAAFRINLDQQGRQLSSLDTRVGELEAFFRGTDFINTQQAQQYIQMVNILGEMLKKKKAGNQAIVHSEVKKRFHVPSYQLIPEAQYPELVAYLTTWWQQLAPREPLPSVFRGGDQRRMF